MMLAFFGVHAARYAPRPIGRTVVFVKAHGFTASENSITSWLTIGDRCADEVVAFVQRDGDDAGFTQLRNRTAGFS